MHPVLGPILTDGAGRTLYIFTRDEPDKSNCTGPCLAAWPPLLTDIVPPRVEGVRRELVGVITRPEGRQVTYNRRPLYYYAPDARPGDALGQGVGGVWFVLNPAGEPVLPTPTPTPGAGPTPTPTPGGYY